MTDLCMGLGAGGGILSPGRQIGAALIVYCVANILFAAPLQRSVVKTLEATGGGCIAAVFAVAISTNHQFAISNF